MGYKYKYGWVISTLNLQARSAIRLQRCRRYESGLRTRGRRTAQGSYESYHTEIYGSFRDWQMSGPCIGFMAPQAQLLLEGDWQLPTTVSGEASRGGRRCICQIIMVTLPETNMETQKGPNKDYSPSKRVPYGFPC